MFKKIKITTFILFLTFVFFSSKAEIIENIKISGNERISEETIKVYGDFKLKQNLNERDLDNILKNLFSTNFFEDIKINLKNNTLFVEVKEYPVINQILIFGETSKRLRDQLKEIISIKENKAFIQSNVFKDVALIKKLYSSAGFNNSKVEIKTKNIDKNNLDLLIEINKGQESRIKSITFIGDKKIRDGRLRNIIASEEDKFWKVISNNSKFSEDLINLDVRLLRNYYKSIGYYDVEINSNSATINNDGKVDLTYTINAGKKFKITKISLNVDPVFDKDKFFSLNKNFKKYVGTFYSPFSIKDLLEDLDELIENQNLQFTSHNVEEIVNDITSGIEIKFNIFESEKTNIEKINIVGNNVTNEDVIRGELLLDEGDPFSQLGLDKSIAKIKSRNIFNSVNSKVVNGSAENLKVIEIEVEEKPTGEISAGAGVGTNGGTIAFNVSENNWLGQGKKLNFEVEVDEESLSGQINYSNPNYDFYGNSINYFLESTSNDKPNQGYENTTISSGIRTSFEQYKDLFATLGLSATYDDLRTQSNASSTLKKQAGEYTELAGTYGFKYDKRNRSFMPTSGSIVGFEQSLPIYADKRSISNSLSFSNYHSVTDDIIGVGKVFITAINGIGDDEVRLSNRKYLSTNKLRGFEKGKVGPVDGTDHVGGNYAAAVNLEANLPNLLPESSRTEVGFFLDFGNVWGVDYDDTLDESNTIRSSAGLAASWLSPIGPLTFVLSNNLNKASTDKTQSFSFNLGTTF